MKFYLINDYIDRRNHPKIVFYELLDEKEYRFYIQTKLKLHELVIPFENFFNINILQFEPREISDIEYSILNKYEPKGTYYPSSMLLEYLIIQAKRFGIKLPERTSEITDEQLMEVVNAIAK